jgi:hypothetical protein
MTCTEGSSPPHRLTVIMPQLVVECGAVMENYFVLKRETRMYKGRGPCVCCLTKL